MKIGCQIERLSYVDSTNNYAAQLLLTNSLPEGSVVLADCQTVGRGQINNRWESECGKNLTFSVVLFPEQIRIERQFLISKCVSLAIASFLKRYAENVAVKWPNDIYLGDRKICGVLIENAIRDRKISSSIIGIGLNINQEVFYSDAPNPVSLSQVTGICYDLDGMLTELLSELDSWYQLLVSGNEDAVDQAYERNLYRKGVWARYRDAEGEYEGMITGVDSIGRLRIQRRDGAVSHYHFKEVAFV